MLWVDIALVSAYDDAWLALTLLSWLVGGGLISYHRAFHDPLLSSEELRYEPKLDAGLLTGGKYLGI